MNHHMNLQSEPFNAIKEGRKTIEMRLFDEKRSKIKVDDTIEFTNTATNEVLYCQVINLYRYPSFAELYANHGKRAIGYRENEVSDPADMSKYYPPEKIYEYGVIGIEIKVCQK